MMKIYRKIITLLNLAMDKHPTLNTNPKTSSAGAFPILNVAITEILANILCLRKLKRKSKNSRWLEYFTACFAARLCAKINL